MKADSSVDAGPRTGGALSGGASSDPGRVLLRQLERFGEKPGLARIQFLLAALGTPQDEFPAIHVAGTNGKGSTCAMIAAVLQAAGLRVGLFTSPHLIHYNERIIVDGEPVDDDGLAALLQRIEPHVAAAADTPGVGQPTEFEVATAVALAHFADEGVDVAVIEVGLGGRLDSTNVVNAAVSVITPIGIDHTHVLGNTLAQIAAEKAGIMRPGVPVVTGRQLPEAAAVIRERAEACRVPLHEAGVAFAGRLVSMDVNGTTFDLRRGNEWLPNVHVPLVGAHQADNAAIAVAAVDLFIAAGKSGDARTVRDTGTVRGAGNAAVTDDGPSETARTVAVSAIRIGLRNVRWPGRFETIGAEPLTIVDGAHNAESAQALASTLAAVVSDTPIVFVIGMLVEKSSEQMLNALLPLAAAVVFTKPNQGRTAPASPGDLAAVARRLRETTGVATHTTPFVTTQATPLIETRAAPAAAIARARHIAGPDGVVVVCGSLYLVGEVKALPAGEWQTSRE